MTIEQTIKMLFIKDIIIVGLTLINIFVAYLILKENNEVGK